MGNKNHSINSSGSVWRHTQLVLWFTPILTLPALCEVSLSPICPIQDFSDSLLQHLKLGSRQRLPGRSCCTESRLIFLSCVFLLGGFSLLVFCSYRNILFPLWPPTVISKDCSHCQFIICLLSLALYKLPHFLKYIYTHSHFIYNMYVCIYIGIHMHICVFSIYSSYLQEDSQWVTVLNNPKDQTELR